MSPEQANALIEELYNASIVLNNMYMLLAFIVQAFLICLSAFIAWKITKKYVIGLIRHFIGRFDI